MKPMKEPRREAKEFTKEDIKFVIQNWDKFSTKEIAEQLGRVESAIPYLVKKIRLAGLDLPKKTKSAQTQVRVVEALKELGLIK